MNEAGWRGLSGMWDALAARLREIHRRRETLRDIIVRGRAWVTKYYNWERVARETVAALEQARRSSV